MDNGDEASKEIFVGNLSFQTDEDAVRNRFKKYGTIVNLKVPSFQGRPKGIAFIEFSKAAEAKKAIDAENGNDFDGRNLKVNLSGDKPAGRDFGGASNGGSSGESSTLFVGNLGFRTTPDSLRQFFSEAGSVKDVRIAMNEENRPKGFAHVEFDSPADAQAALKFNGSELDGR